MNRSPKTTILILSGMLGLVGLDHAVGQTMKAAAQPAPGADGTPAITGISPPGATTGKTTEWTVSGVNLAGVSEWRISGLGVKVLEANTAGAATKLKVQVDPNAETGYREVRAVGPTGISNLGLIRVDRLEQVAETEPNDSTEQASPLKVGSAAWGVLKPQDLDYFRIPAKAGMRLTIELEAQRVGTPIIPVLTLMTARGAALAQARESRGIDHDARLSFTFPTDGDYLIQVRDDLYAGADSAAYRLRVEEAPFATAMFPLGGPRGATIDVTVSGGTLPGPRTKSVTLPDRPGGLIDPGPFDGPGGPVLAPMKLLVGDGPEIVDSPADATGQSTTPIAAGATANGRISAPGEVDRYTVAVKKGSPIAVRIRAWEMGSWLDSVVTVRDASGTVLIENDDAGSDTSQRNGFSLNQAMASPDSRLLIDPKADGELTIEVADRYGEGGLSYGYRVEVGQARPDFGISLLFANPALNQAQVNSRTPRRATSPGSTGSLNLKAGQSIPINFLITAEGKTGPIEVHAEGLPPGVTVQPKVIKPTASAPSRNARGQANADSLVLKVEMDAETSLGELRIVAVARPENSPELVRTAVSAIAIDTPLPGSAPPRPVMRTLTSLPLRVIGGSKAASSDVTAADSSTELAFRGVTIPGVLLQGGRLALELDLRPRARAAREGMLESKVLGTDNGLTVEPVLNASGAASEGPVGIIRVIASVDAKPGAHSLSISLKTKAGQSIERTATVIVRPPISVVAREGIVELIKGKPTNLWVGITRESGFDGPVDLKLDLPKGVRIEGQATVPAGEPGANIVLIATDELKEPFAVRITGVARMPQGPVRVDSAIRPMIVSRTAENGE
ncbi:MAG: Bacterial Ig-like domain [Planctomycetota bacterium]|nr:Bacterial Ig-like domain [Planctomycetota bacterium]